MISEYLTVHFIAVNEYARLATVLGQQSFLKNVNTFKVTKYEKPEQTPNRGFSSLFDALTAHTVVPIIPAWLIYAYAVPIEFTMVYGLDKILNALKVRWSR